MIFYPSRKLCCRLIKLLVLFFKTLLQSIAGSGRVFGLKGIMITFHILWLCKCRCSCTLGWVKMFTNGHLVKQLGFFAAFRHPCHGEIVFSNLKMFLAPEK